MPALSRTEDPTPQSRCRFALKWCDITPPADIYHRMWGAAKHERATGVHRPLRATVTVFAPMEGSERQILLALDHCVMGATEHANLVAQAAEIGGVAKEEILVVFSHTHGAGLMGLDRANRARWRPHSAVFAVDRREGGRFDPRRHRLAEARRHRVWPWQVLAGHASRFLGREAVRLRSQSRRACR
jgi:hypothetical protein